MGTPDPDLVARAQAVLERVADDWLADPAVVAVEVARRWRSGAPTDEIGIRVSVRPADDDGIPELDVDVPAEVDGVPVDVVERRPPMLEA